MEEFCSGNCSACPFAEKNAAKKRPIDVAVIRAGKPLESRTISFRDSCINLRYVPEISSILDNIPDVVLNLIDSTNLDDSLYPATKLMDLGLKTVLVFENYQQLLATDHSIDCKTLESLMGFPVLTGEIESEKDIKNILLSILDVYENGNRKKVKVPYGTDIEEEIAKLSKVIDRSKRYLSLRLLEKQDYILPYIRVLDNEEEILLKASKCRRSLEKEFGETAESLIQKARRGFINGALQETLRHSSDNSDHTRAQKIDAILTSRWLGLPLLILVLFGVFEATFTLGAYPQQWIESGINALSGLLHAEMSPGWFTSMLVDGVVQGVGAVLAFLPNIIILFFFLSILEDTGYMARAAFIMDKIMHRIGLHGRSFIPMLIGFGCNVPAIMAARSIDDKKDRTLTMLMIPFMSCSARLPVYMLFVSAFFAKYKALVMISIYVAGIVLSIIFAFIMKHTRFFRKKEDDYVSELPPFRKPTLRNTGEHIWERVSDYLKKISTVILIASVAIWALEYFPVERTDGGVNKEESYLADIGKWMQPVMEPLGFDWKMNVCILTGLPAKEAIVSTMGILYHSDEGSLPETMRNEKYENGENVFTPGVSLAFMIFVLLYFPCIATIATLRRETGPGWAAFTVVHSLLLAWLMAFLIFHIF